MSTTTTTERRTLLANYRRWRSTVHHMEEVIRHQREALDAAKEAAADAEAELAADLLANGPIMDDGRRYEGRGGEGYDWVEVFPEPAQVDPNPRPEDCACPFCAEMAEEMLERGRALLKKTAASVEIVREMTND